MRWSTRNWWRLTATMMTRIGNIGGIIAPILPPNPLRRSWSHGFGLEIRRARLGLRQKLWRMKFKNYWSWYFINKFYLASRHKSGISPRRLTDRRWAPAYTENTVTEKQFLEILDVAEAAADITVRNFMEDHLQRYHAMQLTTKQKLVVAGAMFGVAAVAAACTPQGRRAVQGTVTKTRCKIARFFAPKVTIHPEDPSIDHIDIEAVKGWLLHWELRLPLQDSPSCFPLHYHHAYLLYLLARRTHSVYYWNQSCWDQC